MSWFLLCCLVQPLGAATQDSSTASSPVTAYIRMLDALDNDSLDAISAGVAYFQLHLKASPLAVRDSACVAFITFFHATISRHNDRAWEDYECIAKLHEEQGREEADIKEYLNALKRNGLALYRFGRLVYIDQQPDFVYRQFAPHVSQAVSRYLALRRRELGAGFSDSDSLLISFRQVGARIVRWERYLMGYPQSVIAGTARYYYQLYLSTFLTGLRRSPVFDKGGDLDPRLSTVYHEFASRRQGTEAGVVVREFYTILQEAEFRWSPQVRTFYEAHAIRNMHREQVPYR